MKQMMIFKLVYYGASTTQVNWIISIEHFAGVTKRIVSPKCALVASMKSEDVERVNSSEF